MRKECNGIEIIGVPRSGQAWLMRISLVEVMDIVGGIGQVVSGFPGMMLGSTFVASPFHQVL